MPAHVINTSSSTHKLASTGIDFESLDGRPGHNVGLKKFTGMVATCYFTWAHADILVSCVLHPGSMRTDLQKKLTGWMQRMLNLTLPAALRLLLQHQSVYAAVGQHYCACGANDGTALLSSIVSRFP
ncbi:hypothetical protein B0H17DRAFT_1134822 [Mycena rosella]|uniref:Uncharacterized protein n=1 Tax=Mycena rosella TaxID=1033263 RepID=A0AAD7DGE8_MYCRO|nr:hypothetical protein B0H17DRAFT_1134822 [Mycena rosella]